MYIYIYMYLCFVPEHLIKCHCFVYVWQTFQTNIMNNEGQHKVYVRLQRAT